MEQELLHTPLHITRSIFEALRKHVVYHGYLPDETLYTDSPEDILRWHEDIKAIDQTKGFHIDMFSESSARSKGMKNTPRIIIFLNRVIEGDIGAPTHTILGPDKNDPTKFRSGYTPAMSSTLIFSIHLMSVTTQQTSVLNSILSNVLGQRRFIDYYARPEKKIFIYQSSFADLDNSAENILEKAYYYTTPDIFLGDEVVVRDNISGIKEILVEDQNNQPITIERSELP